ncbi:biopolymer transporter ExbD [Pantoea agglomerans]|uniref:biopolymer transporter ExbD n=1 Tax=Enterobacter agglomerans TaxID=549 RepID=UPI00045C9760|nr:biopolymer transporter ExbD [Pantoea agglomerans]KDA91910.1 biopolymer transporter ExbD [Pantoea agglomerans Eh318]
MAIIINSGNKNLQNFPVMSEINVTPFIDVMLVLLIIFMVVAPLSTTNVSVKLPSIEKKIEPVTGSPLTVTIRENGDVYIMDEKIVMSGFSNALIKEVGVKKDKQVFLRADKNVNYGEIMTLMNNIQKVGVNNVALVAMDSGNE